MPNKQHEQCVTVTLTVYVILSVSISVSWATPSAQPRIGR